MLNIKKKSILAVLLCISMVISVLAPINAADVAAASSQDSFYATEGDALNEEEFSEEIETEEGLSSENTENEINFAVVEEGYISTPATDKYIVIDMGDGSVEIEDASLTIYNVTSKKSYTLSVDTILDSSMLFYMSFPDESYTGKYKVTKLEYTQDGTEYEKDLAESDLLPVFGVNTDVNEKPDEYLDLNADASSEVVTVADIADDRSDVLDISDEFKNADAIGVNGRNSSVEINDETSAIDTDKEYASRGEDLADSIVDAVSQYKGSSASSSGNVVIVLDPGHGGADSGAVATWDGVKYCERDINQKIANACKAELSKRSDITVYLTRTNTTEALHGSGSDITSQDLMWRCQYAYNLGADLFVSLHCNSASAAAHGAEVWVPNKNYNLTAHNVAQTVGGSIVSKLAALGLTNRGTKTRDGASKYADGSTADYYGIIRNCKRLGIPGMIVEHAFVSNKDDAQKFFGSDAKIAKLGVADAQGIIASIDTVKNNRTGGQTPTGGKGWSNYNGKKVYLDENGNPLRGFFTVDGNTYYADENGYVQTGLKAVNGSKYYFNSDGVMVKGTWQKIGSINYYFTASGAMAKGWTTIGSKTYYFKKNGKRYSSGWHTISSKKYYFKSNGSIYKNKWKYYGSYKRYLASDGHAVTGLQVINGGRYYFSKSANMQYGWQKSGSKKYYMSWTNGKALTGWHTIWGQKYYFNKKGVMKTGFTKVKSKTYYLYKSGGYATGWKTFSGKKYYFSYKGVMKTGWTKYNGNKAYLMTDTGELAKSRFVTVNEKTYYFNRYYKMLTGMTTINSIKYHFSKKGVMSKSKWITLSGKKYYAESNGQLACNKWLTIDGKKCYFGSDGVYKEDADESEATTEDSSSTLYSIMGKSTVTVDQMVKRFNKTGKTYPAAALKKGGAENITQFCTILKEEAEAEGVKPEVLFCQAMQETGWLQFGGQVKVSQFNFGGLGATDGGASGGTFKDVRTGLRAQTQHLKAYACKDALKNTCVDGRFKYVTRGCAPYVEYLGQKENPSGKGWATAERYGYKIVELIKSL